MNIKIILIALAISVLALPADAQGLRFIGMEDKIESRTSYEVFVGRQPSFRDVLRIEFELAVYPPSDFGYILRLKNKAENRVFNLLYSGPGWDADFPLRLNEEGRSSIIKADIPHDYISTDKWMSVLIEFNLISGEVILKVDEYSYSATIDPLSNRWKPDLSFGKSEYFIDVPTFAIRNLKVSDDRKAFLFPLNETEGTSVHENRRRTRGEVTNPEWLLEKSYRWTLVEEFSSSSVAGVNYDHIRNSVVYYNQDSLFSYDVSMRETKAVKTLGCSPIPLFLGRSFINPADSLIYIYEALGSAHGGDSKAGMVSLDPESGRWDVVSNDALPIHFHHHSSYLDTARRHFVIFGGFGDMIYNGDFYAYDMETRTWENEGRPDGDAIFPRYFTSVGYVPENDEVYIFGGMGNECGEQVVGRHYFYDLHRIDLKTGKSEALWGKGLDWKEENMVPVRNMVMDGGSFYTICYPEFLTNSYLQLYCFDIERKTYRKLCNPVPIRSDKMATNANLFYDSHLRTMVLTVQESEDDISSHLKIYTLTYPPLTEDEYSLMSRNRNLLTLWLLGSVLLLAGFIYYRVVRSAKKKAVQARELGIRRHAPEDRNNSICLFGGFTALDPNGLPVQFPLQLRKLLLLIIKYNLDNGLSSRRMSSILWPDKPEDKVKNSRGVALNHLRALLRNFDGVSLVYDDSHFKLSVSGSFYCDWFEFKKEVSSEKPDIDRLICLASRGKFMQFTDDPAFDSFKERTEIALINQFTSEMENYWNRKSYLTVVEMADIVLVCDPLNEQALIWLVNALVKLKKSDEAMVRYSSFAAEYLSDYESEYNRDFKSLLM